jgi:hypothetical protein
MLVETEQENAEMTLSKTEGGQMLQAEVTNSLNYTTGFPIMRETNLKCIHKLCYAQSVVDHFLFRIFLVVEGFLVVDSFLLSKIPSSFNSYASGKTSPCMFKA